MERDALLERIRELLARTGFYLSDVGPTRGLSFDVFARRDRNLIIIKVLTNVDALAEAAAEELKTLATNLRAIPLIVGARSGGGALEPGVVYGRFGVPILSLETLREYLETGVPPFIFSAPGGLYVKMQVELLRQAREQGVSLGSLAEVAHVSRRSIQLYLEGMSATIEAASRLEEFLGQPLIIPIDPFRYEGAGSPPASLEGIQGLALFERRVLGHLRDLGFDIYPVLRSPFDAITQADEVLFVTGLEGGERDLRAKAHAVASISRVAERDCVLFVRRRDRRAPVRGIPIIESRELAGMGGREEMVELVEERKS